MTANPQTPEYKKKALDIPIPLTIDGNKNTTVNPNSQFAPTQILIGLAPNISPQYTQVIGPAEISKNNKNSIINSSGGIMPPSTIPENNPIRNKQTAIPMFPSHNRGFLPNLSTMKNTEKVPIILAILVTRVSILAT